MLILTKAQAEAAAEVLCDGTALPIIDCDYLVKLMVDAINGASCEEPFLAEKQTPEARDA